MAIPDSSNVLGFVQGGLPRDDLKKPYELQESDSMDLSYENSGNSALLKDAISTLMVDAYQKGKIWLLNRMTMPAELSKLESFESMRVCFWWIESDHLLFPVKELFKIHQPSGLRRSGTRNLLVNGGDPTTREFKLHSQLHKNANRFDDTRVDANPPSRRTGSGGRYLSSTDFRRNGQGQVNLGTSRYNWSYIHFQALMARYSLFMLFSITNAGVIPIEIPNSVDAGDTSKPTGNQISSVPSAMDVMAVISVIALAFLVYLSIRNSRHPHIDLGISLLIAFWIHWTVFVGDASIFLFSV